jgi:hypothetical protein
MEKVRQIMEDLAAGRLDPFVGYGRLHRLYSSTTGTHDDLRQFFIIPGVDPCGTFTADDNFQNTVREMAKDWLERSSKPA